MNRDFRASTCFCRTLIVFCILVVLIEFALCDKDRCNGAYAKRYKHCKCREEFAVIVKERHIRREDLEEPGLFHSIRGRKGKTRYYYCRPCSICQDGLQVISQCIGAQNTKCGQHCTDPTRIYDRATKSCQPKSFIYGVEFAEAKQDRTYETILIPNPVHDVQSFTTDAPLKDKQTRTNDWAPSNATTANNLSKIYTVTKTNHTLPVTTVAVACSVIIAVVVVVIVCLCRRSGQDVGPSDDAEKGKSDCLEENESK